MTLQNGVAFGDRAMLWSDTQFIQMETMRPIGYGAKMFAMPMFPAAISLTTIGGDPHAIPREVGKACSLSLGGLLETCEQSARDFIRPLSAGSLVRILVAGWCHETRSARLFAICSNGEIWGQPFEAIEVANFFNSGNKSEPYLNALASGFTPENVQEIIAAQRARFESALGTPIEPELAHGGHLLRCEVRKPG